MNAASGLVGRLSQASHRSCLALDAKAVKAAVADAATSPAAAWPRASADLAKMTADTRAAAKTAIE